jgi:hypothetical protein
MKKTIYLSGPITDMPEGNKPLFDSEAARLRGLGFDVINPWELNPDGSADWLDCMLVDLPAVKRSDAIAFLPGWLFSSGCQVEYITARKYKLLNLGLSHEITEAL